MTDGLNVDDGMALVCKHCRWRPDADVTTGVLAAHFETEHDTDHIEMELVVLCPKCDQPMEHDRSQGDRDHFSCYACFRSRVIRRA